MLLMTYIRVWTLNALKARMVERNKKQFSTLLQNASSSQKLSEALVYLYEGHNFSLYKEGEGITVLFLAIENKVEFKTSYTVSGRD